MFFLPFHKRQGHHHGSRCFRGGSGTGFAEPIFGNGGGLGSGARRPLSVLCRPVGGRRQVPVCCERAARRRDGQHGLPSRILSSPWNCSRHRAESERRNASAERHGQNRPIRARLRASARALVLFALGRRADHRAHRRTRQEGPPAGAGADRHRQHVRCARILRKDGRQRHPADHRLRARHRFRRPGNPRPGRRCRLAAAGAPCLPRRGLSQPDAAVLARLSGYAAAGTAASQAWPGSRARPAG